MTGVPPTKLEAVPHRRIGPLRRRPVVAVGSVKPIVDTRWIAPVILPAILYPRQSPTVAPEREGRVSLR